MSVTEIRQAVGQWNVRLRGNIPAAVLDRLEPFGHVAIIPGSMNVAEYGDNLLDAARYVGIYRSKNATTEGITLNGVGMAAWLGDESGFGDVFETAVELTDATYVATITALLPPGGSIVAGTITAQPGLYSGRHQWVTPRKALDYVTDLYGTEWRVNNDATLDSGTAAQLGYAITPRAILVARKDADDLRYKALPGRATMTQDVTNYTTRVVVLGEGEGEAMYTGEADAPSVPYNDLHGNDVVVTRVVSESDTLPENVDARAAVLLGQLNNTGPTVSLSTEAYDLKGDVVVGDYIYVYNPANGFEDPAVEVTWNGEIINPVALRVSEMSWPIRPGWTVAFRNGAGVWTDLSPYVFYESGETSIAVGELPWNVSGGITQPIGSRPSPDTTVPDVPVFGDFSVGAYQSNATNTTKAAIRAQWSTPLNTDGSVILDGDRYEIRYRVDTIIGYGVEWAAMEAFRWGDDPPFSWGAPLSEPVEAAPEWQTAVVGWGTNAFTLTELTPGVQYELQIRAVDAATPPHFGAWSTSSLVLASGDLFAPSAPAAPTVAASRIGLMVTHTLGKASGGTFNLEQDLDHLEVHVGGSMDFLCVPGSMVGKLIANAAMLGASIPAVGDFKVEQTAGVFVKVVAVDRAGNKSDASVGAAATALLIDNAHISDLSVSKLTAGTITAQSVLAAVMEVGLGGNIILNNGAVLVRDELGRTIIEMGKRTLDPAGGYGFTVFDAVTGFVVTRLGMINDPNNDYGVEAQNSAGDLVSLGTMAFGMQSNDLGGSSTTISSTSWADPPDGLGPNLTDIEVGSSRRMLVIVSAAWSTPVSNPYAYAGFQVIRQDTGAATISGSDTSALQLAVGEARAGMSAAFLMKGAFLPVAGKYTVRARYRVSVGSAVVQNRAITVLPF